MEPLRNDQFRALVLAKPISQPSSSAASESNKPASSNNQSSSQSNKSANGQSINQSNKPEGNSRANRSRAYHQKRHDRSKNDQSTNQSNQSQSSSQSKSHNRSNKSVNQPIDRDDLDIAAAASKLTAEQSKMLGGDARYTGLVRGLDVRLLRINQSKNHSNNQSKSSQINVQNDQSSDNSFIHMSAMARSVLDTLSISHSNKRLTTDPNRISFEFNQSVNPLQQRLMSVYHQPPALIFDRLFQQPQTIIAPVQSNNQPNSQLIDVVPPHDLLQTINQSMQRIRNPKAHSSSQPANISFTQSAVIKPASIASFSIPVKSEPSKPPVNQPVIDFDDDDDMFGPPAVQPANQSNNQMQPSVVSQSSISSNSYFTTPVNLSAPKPDISLVKPIVQAINQSVRPDQHELNLFDPVPSIHQSVDQPKEQTNRFFVTPTSLAEDDQYLPMGPMDDMADSDEEADESTDQPSKQSSSTNQPANLSRSKRRAMSRKEEEQYQAVTKIMQQSTTQSFKPRSLAQLESESSSQSKRARYGN